jgi:hypothetical protein
MNAPVWSFLLRPLPDVPVFCFLLRPCVQITRQAAIQLLAEGALVMPRASWETNT